MRLGLYGGRRARASLTRDFGIQRAGVACLLHLEDFLDPGHHLVGAGVRRLVQVDEASLHVLFDVAVQGRRSVRQRSVVVGTDVQLVEVLQEQRPLRGVQLGDLGGGLDLEVALLLQRANVIAVQGLLLDLLLFLLLAYFCGRIVRLFGHSFNSSLARLTHVGHFIYVFC